MSQSRSSDLTAVSIMRKLGLEPDPTRPLGLDPLNYLSKPRERSLAGSCCSAGGTPAKRAGEGSLRAFLRRRVWQVSRIPSHVLSRLLSLVVRREKVMLGVWLPK